MKDRGGSAEVWVLWLSLIAALLLSWLLLTKSAIAENDEYTLPDDEVGETFENAAVIVDWFHTYRCSQGGR